MDLLKILYEFNLTFGWIETLEDIKDGVLDYNDAITNGDENPAAVLQDLLPVYWQIVRTHNTCRWEKADPLPSDSQYDVGIFLVGFSALPIVLSIAEIQPRQEIYFLHSEDTTTKCDEITNRIEELLVDPPKPFNPLIERPDAEALIDCVRGAERCQITEPSDPVETFKHIKEIIDRLDPGTKIALDLTGGKKTMIGGGFIAGSIYSLSPKCDMFYVDSSEYDPDFGAPKPGTEFLSRLDNPYDVYNVQSIREAEKLFEKHNYEAAAGLWGEVRKNLESPDTKRYGLEMETREVINHNRMANCYYLWDGFYYDKAKNSKNRHDNSWEYNEKHVKGTIDVLNILSEVRNRKTLFDETRIIHYAVDRYQNAIRRRGSGKLDDAIVRFTQVVEMLCNYKVYQIAANNDLVTLSDQPVNIDPNKTWSTSGLRGLIRFLFKQSVLNDDGKEYKARDNSILLETNNYGVKDVGEVTRLIEYRNELIHVNNPMSEKKAKSNTDALQDLAKKFLENFSLKYLREIGLSFDDLLELHRFRR